MQGKMLKVIHKSFLRSQGLRPTEFLYLKEDYDSYTFLHRGTDQKIIIRR